MTLEWTEHKVDGDFAKEIRKGIRLYRREKGRQGHRFRFDDLRVLWGAHDRKGKYALASHNEDRLWQFWYCDPEEGWKLQSWFKHLKDAQEEAERPIAATISDKPQRAPGNYIHASWDGKTKGNPIRVRYTSDYTRDTLADIFDKLGCTVTYSEVS